MQFRHWTHFFFPFVQALHVSGYPIGAPVDTCLTMHPKHLGTQTQLERDVYVVSSDSLTYVPNQSIRIRIFSPVGRPVMGVQIRAHRIEINQEEILGTYKDLFPTDKLWHVNCQGQQHNMVTHANNMPVPSVEMTWVAPDINVGPVIFKVTVVESFHVFYYGLKSAVITPALGSPPMTFPPLIVQSVNDTVAPIDWEGCGDTKGCLLYPRYCTGDNCKVAVSYSVNTTSDTATFELMVKGQEFVSLGFSHDMTMGNDQTISCCSLYGRVNILHGWNHPLKFNVQDTKTNLTQLEASRSQGGNIYCRFTRPRVMDLSVTYDRYDPLTQMTLTFDLNKEHYLFLAWGSTYRASDILGYHYEMPVMSETPVDFSDNRMHRGSVMSKLMRAHSTMMAIAWMGFAGLAFMIARHYKDGFRDKTVCGIKIWFHIHRISAIITFTLTIAGLVVVLINKDGEVTMKESAHSHMCLGFTVVALVCAQLLGGFLRPAPDKKFRPIFNFIHRLLGTSAIVIAAAALICAYKIQDFTYDVQRFGEKTVAVWAGIFVLLEIVHTGYKYFMSKLCVHTSRSDEYDLDKESTHELAEPGSPSYILLAVFLLFIACSITVACCMTLFF